MVIALGWDYVGRIRNRDLIKLVNKGDWTPCKNLYGKATYQARYLGEHTTTRRNPLNSYLYLIKQKLNSTSGQKGRKQINRSFLPIRKPALYSD